MAQRQFGPILGAGVRVEEIEGDRVLDPAPLGVTVHVGVYQRGTVGTLLSTYSRKALDRLVGGRIPESIAPDAAQDFWEHSEGAGELHLVRVSDGTDTAATLTLFGRGSPRRAVMKLTAGSTGRWAGQGSSKFGQLRSGTAVTTNTILTTLADVQLNELAGATLVLDAVASKSYKITGNTAVAAPTPGAMTAPSGTVITVDVGNGNLVTDAGGAAPTSKGFTVSLPRVRSSELSVSITAGENDPVNEWGLNVFLGGTLAKRWPDLSSDPTSPRYFAKLINDDQGNNWVVAKDLLEGLPSRTANDKPATYYGTTSSLTANQLQLKLASVGKVISNQATPPAPTVTTSGTTDQMTTPLLLVATMTSVTAFNVALLPQNRDASEAALGIQIGTGTVGTPFTPSAAPGYVPGFTLSNGTGTLASGDVVGILYQPLQPNELVGSQVYSDPANFPGRGFRVSANDHRTINISSGDLTDPGLTGTPVAAGGAFTVAAPLSFTGGRDGISGITDESYTAVFDISTSPLNALAGQNKGLVKIAIPGVTSSAVQRAAQTYAEAKNFQLRREIPSYIVLEDQAIGWINDTLGRSDFGKVHFPSYGMVPDPDKPGALKEVSLSGMLQGREALFAKTYQGYHKAAAGIDSAALLPRIISLPATGLNEEVLNPAGINLVKKRQANFIMWGDRTTCSDPSWKFAHHREQMSHYENQLRDNFDWIIWAINDETTQLQALTALRGFFLPEWQKRAIRGPTLDDAARIKVDSDINTDQTRAEGNLMAEIKLKPADTVERFIIRVGKAGIFESLGS